jgi:hypothetical protein
MKNSFFFIALLITITSCNLQKHVTRSEVNTSSQSESREEMASRLKKETQKDISASKDTRTSENCDTNFQTPGSSITGEKSLSDLLNGGSLDIENAAVRGSVRIDSVTGKLKLLLDEKPRIFPAKFNRTTEIHETTNEQSSEKQDVKASGSKEQAVKTNSSSNTVIKDVERSGSWGPWLLWIGMAACIVFIYIKVRKRLL